MRKVWIGLLVVTSLVSVFFLVKTSCCLSAYFSLNRETKALSTSWNISEKGPSSFALQVSYLFAPQKSDPVKGVTEFSKPFFLNLPSAQNAVDAFAQKSWSVFYNDKDPSINSLQKIFPFKECFQLLLTLGVFVYFLFFQRIIARANQEW